MAPSSIICFPSHTLRKSTLSQSPSTKPALPLALGPRPRPGFHDLAPSSSPPPSYTSASLCSPCHPALSPAPPPRGPHTPSLPEKPDLGLITSGAPWKLS